MLSPGKILHNSGLKHTCLQKKPSTTPKTLVQAEGQFYSLMAMLDAEPSGNPVEIPKTAPVCQTGCSFEVLR